MTTERTRHMGQRAGLRDEAKSMEYSIDGLRATIREILDPIEKIEDIDAVKLHDLTVELAQKIQMYKGIQLDIRKLNRELGDNGIHG